MDAIDWVRSAVIITVGAFILYVLIQSFCGVYSGFSNYGWPIITAYIFGVVLFLKYGLSKK
mgnify:CR=1 FL=1